MDWDQRGAGKSFAAGKPEKMSIDRFVEDTTGSTLYLLKRFHQKKLYIIGHSWGTLLGVLTVTRYPELYYAYGGVGQYVQGEANERAAYQYATAMARESGDGKAMEELEAISGYPHPIDSEGKWFEELSTNRKWLSHFNAICWKPSDYQQLAGAYLGAPEYTIVDIVNFVLGDIHSNRLLWPDIFAHDLALEAPRFKVPALSSWGSTTTSLPPRWPPSTSPSCRPPRKGCTGSKTRRTAPSTRSQGLPGRRDPQLPTAREDPSALRHEERGMMAGTGDVFDRIAKVEIHLHLEGAIPLPALWELACKYGGDPLVPDMQALERSFAYRDFPHFLEVWHWKNRFIREYEDFTFFSEALARDLVRQNIRYAEVFYSPTDFDRVGLLTPGITEAIRAGLDKVPAVNIALVADLVRDTGPEKAARTLAMVQEVRSYGIIGIGIGGSEHAAPPEPFADVYEEARRLGFHTAPMPGRPRARRVSGAPCARCTPSASGTARGPRRTPRSSTFSPSGPSRWRCARSRTCAPAWSPRSRNIPSGASSTAACSSR